MNPKWNYSLPNEVLEVIVAVFAGMTEGYRADAGYSALYVHHHEPYDPMAPVGQVKVRDTHWYITDNFESTALACLIFNYATKQWTRRVNWARSSDPETDKQVSHQEAIALASKWFSEIERVNR